MCIRDRFLGVGVLVGVFGGLTAIRNYLKV